MNILELWETVEALRNAKAEMAEAFKNAKEGREDETHIGVLAILAAECADFRELYEKESQNCPKPNGVEW